MINLQQKKLRIVFIGTPAFSVVSLQALIEEGFQIVGIVTNPDKPAGRGRKLRSSFVKLFAEKTKIPLLQTDNLKSSEFLQALKSWRADLQIVVAFSILPKEVWNMPPLGTINLHTSYLPQYRGAAPINWVIINGEQQTGVSTFLLQQGIDTGEILFREKVNITTDETAGSLHDKLAVIGASLLIKTVKSIAEGNYETIPQSSLIDKNTALKKAPKITTKDCRINWNEKLVNIYNHIRGLNPFPCAWTYLQSADNQLLRMKIYTVKKIHASHNYTIGNIFIGSNDSELKVVVNGGFIMIESLQAEGKKRLFVKEFLKGFSIEGCKFI